MSLKEWLLDGVFPPTCIGCEADGVWLCDSCLKSIEIRTKASCPQCGHYPWSSHPCIGEWEFASVITLGAYANPVLQTLLRSYKYQRAQCLEPIFEDLLERFQKSYQEVFPWSEGMIVTSLPMDPTRLRERGLDHAFLLADAVQKILLPQASRRQILVRTREVVPNASLSDPRLRTANIKGVFGLSEPVAVPVLLVDDVCTTGATAREAARTLLISGVPEVHLFTFASGVKHASTIASANSLLFDDA